ncbi:MAG: NTP/NDP exchange transporter [Candidatus Babeliales bacterium]
MAFGLRALFKSGEAGRYEAIKVLILSVVYFLVIVTYTLVRNMKNSIFIGVVGKEYIPIAKIAAIFILVPALLFYAYLVDNVRRYQLLMIYSAFFGLALLLSAFYIGNPENGLANTDTSPYRIFGWIFYFLLEGYSPFVLSVFWAYVNSVNSPTSAKKHYGIMIASSKLGGIVAAGLSWLFLQLTTSTGSQLYSDVVNHQILLIASAGSVLCIPVLIYILNRKVPKQYLHGYEAVYQFEKERKEHHEEKPGIFDGLTMFLKWPYLFGIFGMVFFYEVVTTILSYQSLCIAQDSAKGLTEVSSFLLQLDLWMHLAGLFISLLGTSYMMSRFGERICLLLIPILTGVVLTVFLMSYSSWSIMLAFVFLRSINYAFALPVRESLYIPTVKEMKFKSKSWIDAFGSKLSKGTGSGFNVLAGIIERVYPVFVFPFFVAVFAVITALWTLTAYLMGKRFDQAIKNKEAIGGEVQEHGHVS